jgi:hypothetical protein
MLARYEKLWPDHPFSFRVPYQNNDELMLKHDPMPAALVPSPAGIRDTVLTLLEPFADHEWLYWCIDDKYPISLNIRFLQSLGHFIFSGASTGIDGICFCRARQLDTGKALLRNRLGLIETRLVPGVGALFRRGTYAQIWLHQFVRAGVLRALFEAFPTTVNSAKQMDDLKDRMKLHPCHHLYVTRSTHARFGESTSRGLITPNCLESMEGMGLATDHVTGVADREILIGERPGKRRLRDRGRELLSIGTAACRSPFSRR